MNQNTHIANALDTARDKSSYDEHAIRILSNKYILAHILKGTLGECYNRSIEEIVVLIEGTPEIKTVPVHPGEVSEMITGLRNEDKVPGESTTTFDIRFHITIPEAEQNIKILINVEAQRKFYPGYDLVTRGIYYGARMISSQRETEFKDNDYDDIKKVYSLWICTNAPDYAQNTVTQYAIQQEKVFGDFQGQQRYDILNIVFLCLGNPDQKKIPEFLSMLSIALNDKIDSNIKKKRLEQEYKIPMTRDLGKEFDKMCNLSEAIEERGIQKGIEQGIEQSLRTVVLNMLQRKVPIEDICDYVGCEKSYVETIISQGL